MTSQPASRGCVFFNFGTAYGLRLLVAIASLRNHYSGPVAVLVTPDPENEALIRDLRLLDAETIVTPRLSKSFDRNRVFEESPYEATLSFDADMIFKAPIDELWGPLETEGLLLTRFFAPPFGVDGSPAKPGFASRIHLLSGIRHLVEDAMFQRAAQAMLQDRVDINIGVMGVTRSKGAPFLEEWAACLEKGRQEKIILLDEMLVVALATRHRHVLAGEEWNCPADEFFRRTPLPDAKIIHYFAEGNRIHGIPLGRHSQSWAGHKWYEEYQRAAARLDLSRWVALDPVLGARRPAKP